MSAAPAGPGTQRALRAPGRPHAARRLLSRRQALHQPQRGAATVEFALTTGIVCVLLLAGVETGRLLWTWNAAVEATRHGARLAVVCDRDDAAVARGVIGRLPTLRTEQVSITWLDESGQAGACTAADCHAVRVELTGVVHRSFVPVPVLQSLLMPSFSTTLRRESMRSVDNPDCS